MAINFDWSVAFKSPITLASVVRPKRRSHHQMSSLLEEDVCDDVFWLEILPLLNLKDYMALASTSTTMRRRCLAESRPKLPIPVRDLYKLLAPVTDQERDDLITTVKRDKRLFREYVWSRKKRDPKANPIMPRSRAESKCNDADCKCGFVFGMQRWLWRGAVVRRLRPLLASMPIETVRTSWKQWSRICTIFQITTDYGLPEYVFRMHHNRVALIFDLRFRVYTAGLFSENYGFPICYWELHKISRAFHSKS